jgi:hypothetical protein
VNYDAEALFRLLPEVYEHVDGDDGPLRALLGVLATQAERLDENVGQLYADAFIETCAEWVVPYIGDLLGVRGLHKVSGATFSQRGWVANTIGYRRRKGTLSMLRQLAQDVTGYRAAAVEMFQRLEWTQNVNHVRVQNPRTPDLRHAGDLELLGGAFTKGCFSGDVRSIQIPRGKYNIQNIGMFLWRLQNFPLSGVAAKPGPAAGSYTFSPLGLDAPLFNSPEVDPSPLVTGPATEVDVPDVLRRRAVHDDLEAIRRADVLGGTHASPYFDSDPPVFEIRVRGEAGPVPTREIFVCNLETWGKPPTARAYRDANGNPVNRAIRVGVDPLRGRLRFVQGQEPATGVRVLVSYSYGFSSALGGGPYDRTASVNAMLPSQPDWYRVVQTAPAGAAPFVVNSLQQAITDWNAGGAGKHGVIAIVDSETYTPPTLAVVVAERSHLLIVAAQWPPPTPMTSSRDVAQLSPAAVRPHVHANVEVTGSAADTSQSPGLLGLSGLLIEGTLTVMPGHLGGLHLADTTLVPAAPSLSVRANPIARRNRALELRIERCILGGIDVAAPTPVNALSDTIVQGSITAALAPVSLERCTVTDGVQPERLDASDTLFMGLVTAVRTQVGCVRFSFFPEGSTVPRAYRCQPGLAIEVATTEAAHRIRGRMTPSFVSTAYGQPGYLQLAATCAREILLGASNGDEMGAFNRELHSLREANLRFALTEYLRVGLEAGIFYGN